MNAAWGLPIACLEPSEQDSGGMAGDAEGLWDLDRDSGEGWQRSFLQESSLINPRLAALTDFQASTGLGGD